MIDKLDVTDIRPQADAIQPLFLNAIAKLEIRF